MFSCFFRERRFVYKTELERSQKDQLKDQFANQILEVVQSNRFAQKAENENHFYTKKVNEAFEKILSKGKSFEETQKELEHAAQQRIIKLETYTEGEMLLEHLKEVLLETGYSEAEAHEIIHFTRSGTVNDKTFTESPQWITRLAEIIHGFEKTRDIFKVEKENHKKVREMYTHSTVSLNQGRRTFLLFSKTDSKNSEAQLEKWLELSRKGEITTQKLHENIEKDHQEVTKTTEEHQKFANCPSLKKLKNLYKNYGYLRSLRGFYECAHDFSRLKALATQNKMGELPQYFQYLEEVAWHDFSVAQEEGFLELQEQHQSIKNITDPQKRKKECSKLLGRTLLIPSFALTDDLRDETKALQETAQGCLQEMASNKLIEQSTKERAFAVQHFGWQESWELHCKLQEKLENSISQAQSVQEREKINTELIKVISNRLLCEKNGAKTEQTIASATPNQEGLLGKDLDNAVMEALIEEGDLLIAFILLSRSRQQQREENETEHQRTMTHEEFIDHHAEDITDDHSFEFSEVEETHRIDPSKKRILLSAQLQTDTPELELSSEAQEAIAAHVEENTYHLSLLERDMALGTTRDARREAQNILSQQKNIETTHGESNVVDFFSGKSILSNRMHQMLEQMAEEKGLNTSEVRAANERNLQNIENIQGQQAQDLLEKIA